MSTIDSGGVMRGRRQVLRTILVAAAIGAIILGLGGRLAMFAIAWLNTGAGAFTLGGTSTVIAMGALSGAAGGVILSGLRAVVRRRWPPTTTVLFWGALIGITLRGLRPLDGQRLVLFLPLVLAFGLLLQWRTYRSPTPSPGEPG